MIVVLLILSAAQFAYFHQPLKELACIGIALMKGLATTRVSTIDKAGDEMHQADSNPSVELELIQ